MSDTIENALENEKIAVHRWLVNKMLEIVPFKETDEVLDIQVGKGTYTLFLSSKVKNIHALHDEEKSLTILNKKIKQKNINNITVHPAVESYYNLPFDSNSFDVVSCRTAIHHFDDLPLVLKEFRRVLRDDGVLSIMDGIVSEKFQELWTPLARVRETGHNCYYTYLQITKLLREAGFEIFNFIPYKIPRNLNEWLSSSADNVQDAIKNIILDFDEISSELNVKNLKTTEELNKLKLYGIENPHSAWRFWYNVADIVAIKNNSEKRKGISGSAFKLKFNQQQEGKKREIYRISQLAFQELKLYLNEDQLALDLPVGQGSTSLLLSEKVEEVHGFDVRQKAIDEFRLHLKDENIQNIKLYDSYSTQQPLPVRNEMFDIATTFVGTALFPNLDYLFSEVSRVLKNGGHYALIPAVLSDVNRNLMSSIYRLLGSHISRYATYMEIVNSLESNGFIIIKMKPILARWSLNEFLSKMKDQDARYRLKKTILENESLKSEFNFYEKDDDWNFYYNAVIIIAKKERVNEQS